MDEVQELKIENPTEIGIDKDFAKEVFASLADLDCVVEYLTLKMEEDLKKYFNAPDDDSRNKVKGHFAFASHMRSMILKARE